MTSDEAKGAAMQALRAGPFSPNRGDPRAAAIHLLKAEGAPIISRNTGKGGSVVLVHELAETTLSAQEIKKARMRGLANALRCHRMTPPAGWGDAIAAIACPFEKDAAAGYLRGIIQRINAVSKKPP